MKDKEKQIEEMAKIICNTCKTRVSEEQCNSNSREKYGFCSMCEIITEELLKYYQPKIPEDSVVLSREEYELYDVVKKDYPNDMICLAEKFTEISHNSYTKGSKETAEKFESELKAFIKVWKMSEDDSMSIVFYKALFDKIGELAK